MTRFLTLMRREWLQHHRGWMAMTLVPPVALLVLLSVAPDVQVQPALPDGVMALSLLAVSAMSLLIAMGSSLVRLPGLARRDVEDRSVEFWMSLPVPPSAGLGALLLMHAVVYPLAALAVGFLFSWVVGLVLAAIAAGAGSWAGLPWLSLGAAGFAVLARLSLGLVLAMLWLSPLILVLMLAATALKGWGVPAVLAAVAVGGVVLDRVFGVSVIGDTVLQLGDMARRSVLAAAGTHLEVRIGKGGAGVGQAIAEFPGWAMTDARQALALVAQPLFVFALAVSAGCFAGLVALRRRAA